MERELFGIAVIAGVVLTAVGCGWAMAWALVRRAAIDAKVKQEMLARGLSVEEIERLLKPFDTRVKQGMLAPRLSVEADIEPLLEHGLSVEEIERLLTPLPGASPLSVKADIEPLLERGLSVEEIERLLRPRTDK